MNQSNPDVYSALRTMASESFDIHAHYHLFLLCQYEDVGRWYDPHLEKVAESVVADAEVRLKSFFEPLSSAMWPLPAPTNFIDSLRRHLIGRRSHWKAEALKYVRELPEEPAQTAEPAPAEDAEANRQPNDRRALVDSYIDEAFRKTGKRITRKDIWLAARYKTRTEFERWERRDHRATKTADQRFTKLLTVEKPHLK